MKRRLLTLMLTLGTLYGATAQNRSIDFKHEGTFADRLAEATKSNKLIFFDAYTSWCVPCKILAKEVFTVDSVADYFNANFINVGYDMEKGEGIELKKRFASEINAYPTLLFINGKGEVVHKIVGSASAKEFMALARPALSPELSLKGMAQKFNGGDHSLNTVTAYLKVLSSAYDVEKTKEVATTYFDGLPAAELNNPATFDLLKRYLFNPDSKTFKYILANRDALGKIHSADKVNGYLLGNLSREVGGLSNAYYSKKPVDAVKEAWLVKTLETFKNNQAAELLTKMSLIGSRNKGDWDAYNKAMTAMITSPEPIHGAGTKANLMLNFTRKFTEAAPEAHLADGLKWADLLLNLDVNPITAIDLLNFKKAIYTKMGKTDQLNVVDLDLRLQEKNKEELAKKGQVFAGAMRGFL